MSCAICLTLLAGSAAAAEVHFALVDPKEASADYYYQILMESPHNDTTDVVWITGSGETLLDAWNDAATKNGYTYELSGNPSYPNQLSTINGPFTNYEGWGNNGEGFVWWKTYVCDGSNLSTWDNSLSQTGVVLEDHSASEYPYFAFVWGCWATWPYPDGTSGSPYTVFPSDCPLAPVANFTSDVTSGPAPLTVQFEDSSTGSPTSWQWDFDNDGTVDSTEQSPSYTYESTGTYTVSLTVSNGGGSDSEVKTDCITVSDPLPAAPVAAFSATPTSGSGPLTVQFTDESTDTVSSYSWDFDNDGTVDSTEQSPSYTYESTGTYTVGLTVSNGGGNDSEVKTDCITVSDPLPAAPVAAFSATPTSGSGPLTVQFTDESTDTVSSYSWDFDNDGTVDSTEQSPSYTYESAGTYTVNLTVANAEGNDSEVKTDYITVSESSTPTEPVAAFNADVTNGTVPLTVNFTDQSTGSPSSWIWDFGDNTSATEQNPSHTYTSAGTYTVNLTVISESGNSSEVKTDYITVSESSTPTEPEPVAAFNADVTNGTVPLTVNFTDQSTGTPTSWAWDFDNDGSIDSTEQNPSYTYTAEGNYTVNLTVSSAAGSDSEVKAEYITVTDSSTTPEDRPDLIVSSISPSSSITANTSCNIGATINNTGAGDAGAFNATLSVNGVVVDTHAVSGIVSGSSAAVNFSWKPVAAGYYSVKVSADAGDVIAESDETNNELADCIKVEEASSGSQNGSSSVSMNVTIVPVICFEVSPSALKFGELSAGQTSEPQLLTLKNSGVSSINVTAEVSDSSAGDDLFSLGLLLDSQIWSDYWNVIGSNSQENATAALHVPSDYTGTGNKKGTITFWAEAAE
ncbi:cell surface protein [Methanosarcina siciliae C2J]|uniref:Cell surface protein n=1 Tax=Methanosarcina siciliae C2J TaxID=1434118 RepID=A0A0E3PPJ9_9EURY|nr:PKD domain-containing protein [Methanosarcina siciliae]AKB37163.1 cell surface protein [Methanosarcina siciliae C2J]